MKSKNDSMEFHYEIPGDDFSAAGDVSSNVKKILVRLGANPDVIKRVAIAMYEAEMNAVIHAHGGYADVKIDGEKINIRIVDNGPGIPDLDLAMQEGWSTAPESVRKLGFGAGMGLPNIKRYADELRIDTEVGKGTVVDITVNLM